MKTRWIGKNVNFGALSERVKSFLSKKGFSRLGMEETNGNYVIFLGLLMNGRGVRRQLAIKIIGEPNDFEVEFLLSRRGWASKIVGLASLIGVGGLVLRRMKSEEILEALERDFWIYMDEAVEEISSSAKGSL